MNGRSPHRCSVQAQLSKRVRVALGLAQTRTCSVSWIKYRPPIGDHAVRAYEDLLPAAKRDPRDTDFTELRLAYARSSQYEPQLVAKGAAEAFAQVTLARQVGDVARLIKALNALLDVRFLEVEAHGLAVSAYERVGDDYMAAYHRSVVDRYMSSILQSRDGLGFASAVQVVTAGEERAVLQTWGLVPTGRRVAKQRDRYYDIFSCSKGETVETVEIYLDVDPICRHFGEDAMAKLFSGSQSPPERSATGNKRPTGLARKGKPIVDKLYIVSFLCLALGVLLMGSAHARDIRPLGIAGAVVSLLSTLGAIAGVVRLISIASE